MSNRTRHALKEDKRGLSDGWDEGEDLVLDDSSAERKEETGVFEDGWDNSDDLDLEDDGGQKGIEEGWGNEEEGLDISFEGEKKESAEREDEGWIDDEEALAFDSELEENEAADGWEDEELDFDQPEVVSKEVSKAQELSFPVQKEPSSLELHLLQELIDYIQILPRLLPSINAILQAEYNSIDKAQNLMDYYAHRPQLTEYTITKEVNRMDYVIEMADGVVKDKSKIAHLLGLPEFGMTSRCANQSLLADLLQVLTDKDAVVRPQYMATCIARACGFVVTPTSVDCRAVLSLSLPTVSGNRLDVAQLQVSVHFEPPVVVHYQVIDIRVSVDVDHRDALEDVARFLAEHASDAMIPSGPPSQEQDEIRDAFVADIKSAWQQVDSVVNLQQKIQGGYKLVDSLIPNQDLLAAAEESLPEAPANPEKQLRPKSILGGLVSRLASSVTLPDEDPAIYDDYVEQPPPNPRLYQKPIPPPQPQHSQTAPVLTDTIPQLQEKKCPPEPPLELYRRPEVNVSRRQNPKETQKLGSHKPHISTEDAESNRGIVSNELLELQQNSLGKEPPVDDLEGEDLQDGWADYDLDLEDAGEQAKPLKGPTPSSPPAYFPPEKEIAPRSSEPEVDTESFPPRKTREIFQANYNPDDDIIETRKRWVNPRPGNRHIRA